MPKKEKKSKRDIGKKELHRLLYDIFSGNPDQNFNYKQLAQRLGIKNMNAKQLIMTVLYEMKNDNMLTEESTGVFKFKVNTIYVTGIIDLTAKGTAYLISDDCQEDVFIPQVGLNHALNGDKVKVLLYARSSKRRGSGGNPRTQERDIRGHHTMLQTIRLSRSHGQTVTLRYIYPLERLERGQGWRKSHRQDHRVAGEPEEPRG